MKKLLINMAIILSALIALSGCSAEEVQGVSQSEFAESQFSTEATYNTSDNTDVPDDNSDIVDDNTDISVRNENVIKCANYSIDTVGVSLNDMKQAQKKYLLAMDNNYFYFSAESGPFMTKISSVDRNNFSVEQDIVEYDFDVEYGLSTSKRTYCGNYVAFPCSGSPDDEYVTMRALAGRSGEQQKCILEQPTSSISVCVSELSTDEIVFLCSGEKRGIFNIYKYNFSEEQAQLIYTTELDESSQNSNPLINCCNGDIYFIYRSAENKTDYCIKQLDTDGKICDEILVSLPEHYDTSLGEFTVTENNFLIRFYPDDDFGYFQTVLINRKTNEIFSDSGDNKLGVRFNDGMVDGRYMIFRAGSKSASEHPMICVFDDWNSKFNFVEFTEIDSSEIINTVASTNGDIVFFTHEGSDRFVTMYESVHTIIESQE